MQNKIIHIIFWTNFVYFTFVSIGFSKDDAKDLIKKGLQAHNINKKIEYFQQAVNSDPNYNEAYFELGRAYYVAKDYKQAENAFDKALQVSPDNIKKDVKIRFIFEIAKVYVKQKKYDHAISSLQYISEIAEKNEIKSEIFFELGNAYLLSEKFNKALITFKKGVEFNPKNIELLKDAIKKAEFLTERRKLYDSGKGQLEQKKFEKAVKILSIVNATDSSYREVSDKLTEARDSLENQKEKKKRLESVNELPEMFFDEPIIEETGVVKTIVPQKDVVSIIEKYYRKGKEALKNEDWNLAIGFFNKVDAINSNYKNINSLQIEANLGIETSKMLERAVKYYNEGLEYIEVSDWLMAVICFEKAKMLFPGYKDVDIRIDDAKKHIPNSDSFNVSAAHAINKVDTKNSPWFLFGIIASAIFLPITMIFVLSPEIRARYYLLQGNYHKATQLYERILRKHPEKTKVYITLASIYLNNNRSDESALRIYQGALEQELDSMTKEKIKSVVKEKKNNLMRNKNASIKNITDDLRKDIRHLGN